MVFTPDDVRINSPKTLSLVELKSQRDLSIFRKIYAHSIRIGDNAPGWEITYAQEFNMTNDSKHFPSLEKWEAKGYRADVFGRWIGPENDMALPLYEGRMIDHFDPILQRMGKENRLAEIPVDTKEPKPKYLMAGRGFSQLSELSRKMRIGYRPIARTTNTRTFISCYLARSHAAIPVILVVASRHVDCENLALSAILAS